MLGVCFCNGESFAEKILLFDNNRERNGERIYCCGVVECPSFLLTRTLLVVVGFYDMLLLRRWRAFPYNDDSGE